MTWARIFLRLIFKRSRKIRWSCIGSLLATMTTARCFALVLLLLATLPVAAAFAVVPGPVTRTGPLTMTIGDDGSSRRNFLGQAALGTGAAVSLSGGGLLTQPVSAKESLPVSTDPNAPAKIALWGYGNQNQLMAKYLYDRNIPVVAVISHHDIGEDYGMVKSDAWGNIGKKTGVKIVDEDAAAATLAKTRPDVVIMSTRSTVKDLKPSLTVCAQSKVNVITIAEEVLDSWTSSPKLTKELDDLFKANGVSYTGSGFIDGACCEMALALGSMMQRVDGLEGGLQYNVDDYGTVLAEAHGVGLTKAQFQEEIVQKPQAKSYVYNSNEWFVSALGLTLKETKEVREPTTAKIPLKSESVNKMIPVGDCTGMKVIATTTTKEGVTVVGEQVGRCYEPGIDHDSVTWAFKGEPAGVQFTMNSPPTPQMTNTATISRIQHIIDAPPGYITSDKLPLARYKRS